MSPESSGFPKDLGTHMFESPSQALIREGFEAATETNRRIIAEFDPDNEHTSGMPLQITSGFEQIDATEPVLLAQHQQTMLHNLGLQTGKLQPDDPTALIPA
jgi:hypothetical protein